MNKSNWLTIALIAIILLLIWWNVENRESSESYKIEKLQAQKRLRVVQDSIKTVIKRKDEELLKAMRESAQADMVAKDAVADAQKYKQKYDKIVFRATRNDKERDSLIRAVISQ